MRHLNRKSIKLPVIAIAAAAIAVTVMMTNGCSSAGKKYYQLYLPSPFLAAGVEETGPAPIIDKVLLVEKIEVEDVYNDYRLVYRTSPFEINYYAYHFWVEKPERVVSDAIRDYLLLKKVFARVITSFSQGDPDLLLKAKVYVMEEFDMPPGWFARLRMEIEIRDFKTGEQVLFHSFNRQKRMNLKKVGQLPVILSGILKEEIDNVIQELMLQLNKETQEEQQNLPEPTARAPI